MNHYAVGQPYNARRTRWPEGTQYNYREGVHELIVFCSRPHPEEVRCYRAAWARFALHVAGPSILLAFRFGNLPWCDAPYTWHLVPDDQRVLPPADLGSDARTLIRVFLVSADDGVVRALRAMTWSPEFTRAMHRAIRRQSAQPWDRLAYDRTLNAIYAQHRSSASLAKVAVVSCTGGD